MKLLLLGGTVFLGRHIASLALKKGHDLTLFNRGQSNPDLYPEVETLKGDRNGSLDSLCGRRWDAVIDTSGYIPRAVKTSARWAADACDHYTFISTISVYDDLSKGDIEEDAPVGKLHDETVEEVDNQTYGPLKALCEDAVRDTFPGDALIIRPGLIVGRYDPTDRFTYWPRRVAMGGEVLVPGSPDRRVQFIDVRDLAAWTLEMAEGGQSGTYNATGPEEPLTMIEMLKVCQSAAERDVRFTSVSEAFLLEQGVAPWIELPLWMPTPGPMDGLMEVRCRRALDAGLRFRPLIDTIEDTLEWVRDQPGPPYKAGMDPEREQELLQIWSEAAPN